MLRFVSMILLVACEPGGSIEPNKKGPGTDTDTPVTTPTPPVDCEADVPDLPLEVTDRVRGMTGAEDFAFDNKGRYVATDAFGNLVRRDIDGNGGVWVPGFSTTAGTHFMPDGHLAIADVSQGRVIRVQKNGSTETMIGGMAYPNGITVDGDGIVYVADQTTGEVIGFDPETEIIEVLASEMFNPNGLALSNDHRTLYVGSFGGGTVHQIDLDDPGDAVLLGQTPGGTFGTQIDNDCDARNAGDECFLNYIGLGTCQDLGGGLTCEFSVEEDACIGLTEGDPCQHTVYGEIVDSVCSIQPTLGTLFCPRVPADAVTSCIGAAEDDPCTAQGIDRECRESYEELMICDITAWGEETLNACIGLAVDDECVILEYEGYIKGTCEQSGNDLECDPGWGGGDPYYGGLDGVAVDACGYVWATEYTVGYVWRFPPEGGEAELAVETNTFWIPNMHWGNGIGGWDVNTMYMQDRSTNDLLVIPIGIPGAPTALVPVDERDE